MKNRDKIEFFSEIYVEELPARLVNDLGLQLKNNFIKGLAEYNIEYLDIVSKHEVSISLSMNPLGYRCKCLYLA